MRDKTVQNKSTLMIDLQKGKYPTKEIKTKVGLFTLKYPSGRDHASINNKVASLLNGMPRSSFTDHHLYSIDRDVALSVLTEGYPEDFPETWQGDFIDYPYLEVKNSLYEEFGTFCKETREALSKQS